jgi:hypothetical protein
VQVKQAASRDIAEEMELMQELLKTKHERQESPSEFSLGYSMPVINQMVSNSYRKENMLM